ncbi:acyl-CoA-binding protein [Nocardia sp. ET3-3]|uniref:Acyl-CoA-binding protein n=1 Tax=Nocardia terrae TaxID=2675851 RepID=A0A7K1V5J0_9NOCA|nr:acyl-CoA-binding protein [Nocardia terrae]MVU81729.1 acyl-CoA-binding protein [Nocardia terrae]
MTTGLDNAEFGQLAERVKNLGTNPGNDRLLQLYSHFKQATVGDNTTDSPGMFDFTAKAKWHAWNDLKGMSKEAATTEYIRIAKDTLANCS